MQSLNQMSMQRRFLMSVLCCSIITFGWFTYHSRSSHSINKSTNDSKLRIFNCLKSYNVPVESYDYTVTSEEQEFPLAFNVLAYTQPDRVIRLLMAIYRPQNFYCIHVDKKSPWNVNRLLKLYTKCFGTNVFLVPEEQRTAVYWGKFSVLEPEMTCARLLLNRSRRWKYWINLTGQEFPLRTNLELVLALKALNGTNLVSALYKRRNLWRFPSPTYTSLNITWYKGAVHVAVRREFVEYMLNDVNAIRLWTDLWNHEIRENRGIHPDETFFSTLNHNPHVFKIPGAFLGEHEMENINIFIRYKIWDDSGKPCGSGHFLRNICIFGVPDLPFLLQTPHFFANKFLPDVDPIAYRALETFLARKVSFETRYGIPHTSFSREIYSNSELAWNHL